ncbi:MAG: ECF transporter S component [Emergencia sp.]|nr:ECF transporter S component [Emergencia sp.]
MAEGNHLTQYEAAAKKRLRVSAFLIVFVMPLTVLLSYRLLGDRMYMTVSVLLLVLTMAPFFMVFENRKPKAREIVLIGMMSAITVAVHTVFHIILPIQIGTAMVIVSGISLGPEAGFLIGALARLICNFYMGQGPWTPWQMFCWGVLGFLAGLIFNKGDDETLKSRNFKVVMGPVVAMILSLLVGYISYILWPNGETTFFGWRVYAFGLIGLIAGVLLQRKKLPADSLTMAVATFFMSFVIYGGIMNISTLINSANMPGASEISVTGIKLLYIAGVPYDLFHGLSAAVCIFFFGDSIIKKLERIKIKYGIYK